MKSTSMHIILSALMAGGMLVLSGCGKEEKKTPASEVVPSGISTTPEKEPSSDGPTDAKAGAVFAQREFEFTIERDYEQHVAIPLKNDGDLPMRLELRLDNEHQDIIAGFVERQEIELAPGQERNVEFVIFAQDAKMGEYTFTVAVEADGIQDSAQVTVQVNGVSFDLEVTQGAADPATLATPLRITNRGDTLTDLEIRVEGPLKGHVIFHPELVHAKLSGGDLIKVDAVPLMSLGTTQLEGEIVLSAAGSEKRVPLAFTVPEDKKVFFGMAHSIYDYLGNTWFCTNRPVVYQEVVINEDGTVGFEDRQGYSCGPPPMWKKIGKLFSSGGSQSPSATPGVRGGTVRNVVAALRPGLENNNYCEAFTVVRPDSSAAAWHYGPAGDPEIYFRRATAETIQKPVRLTDSGGTCRWPFLAGDPDGTLYLAWEDGRDGGEPEVYFMRSDDAGVSWGDEIRITKHGTGAFDPVIWHSGQNLLVAWEDAREGIYCRTSLDGGNTWKDEIRMAGGLAAWPQISGDDDLLWAAWMLDDGAVYAACSRDLGADWSEPTKVSGDAADAGEPTVVVVSGRGVAVAWRDSRHGQSEIYFRFSEDGRTWSKEIRVTSDEVYNEYPSLLSGEENLYLFYSTPVEEMNRRAYIVSNDLGKTWGEAQRLPGFEPNVQGTYLETNFGLPWDRKEYKKHNVRIRINGQPVAELIDTIPEGRYLFEVDPTSLVYNPGGLAKNELVFDTEHLNGGHYVVSSDYRLLQKVSHMEMAVVAESQAEADRLAMEAGSNVNHDLPDVALYTNRIRGMPEDRDSPQSIELEVEVMNIGAAPAENVMVYVAADGEAVTEEVLIDSIPAWSGQKAKLGFVFDGNVMIGSVIVRCAGDEADLSNNEWGFTLGHSPEGTLTVTMPEEVEVTAFKPSTGEQMLRFTSNHEVNLPVGVYRIVAHSGEGITRENVAVKGGLHTAVDLNDLGWLRVCAGEAHPFKVFSPDGTESLAEGRCNDDLVLDPGFYRIEVRGGAPDGYTERDVAVAGGRKVKVNVPVLPEVTIPGVTHVKLGEPFECLLLPEWDQRTFGFETPGEGYAHVEFKKLASGATPAFRFVDSQGTEIQKSFESNSIWVKAGTYYVALYEQWNKATTSPSRAKVLFTESMDLFEPNNRADNAKTVGLDEEFSFSIYPRWDSDYFRVDLPRDGFLLVETEDPSNSMTFKYLVLDAKGNELLHTFESNAIAAKAGTYTIRLSDQWARFYERPIPLKAKLTLIDNTDPFEPNNGAESASIAKVDQEIAFSLYPRYDRDHFKVEVPKDGYLLAEITDPSDAITFRYQFIDEAGDEVQCSFESNAIPAKAGTYTVCLSDQWDEFYEKPVELTAKFILIDEMDPFEPNNTAETAKPIKPGEEFSLAIFPKWDQDLFKLELERDGKLVLDCTDLPDRISMLFQVMDGNGNVVHDSGDVFSVELEKGPYTVILKDRWSNSNRTAFRATLTLETP